MGIEAGHQNVLMFESLKVANEAGKELQKRKDGSEESMKDHLENLMSVIKEQ